MNKSKLFECALGVHDFSLEMEVCDRSFDYRWSAYICSACKMYVYIDSSDALKGPILDIHIDDNLLGISFYVGGDVNMWFDVFSFESEKCRKVIEIWKAFKKGKV